MNTSNASEPPSLNRVIGLSSSILLVVGVMIGTGIFKKIVPMAASGLHANHIIAAWVVAGIVTILGALSISALTGLTEQSGGEYEYVRIIFGNFIAFIFGWSCFTIIGSASIAAMSFLFTQSFNEMAHLSILNNPLYSNLFSCCIIGLLTWLNVIGTHKSTVFNNIMTYIKIAGILILIFGAWWLFQQEEVHIPANQEVAQHLNGSFIRVFFAAMLSAFWAYDGWLGVAFISGEIKDPVKNVAKSIIIGVSIVMVLYVCINVAFLKIIPIQELASMKDQEIAAAKLSSMLFNKYGHFFISLLILCCSVGSLNGIIFTYARLYYKMSQDGLFFKKAAHIHPTYRTPHMALVYSMAVSCILVFSGSFDMLTDVIVFAGFLYYGLLAFGVFKMKKAGAIQAKGIGYPVVPFLFVLFSIALLYNTFVNQPIQTFAGILLMLAGVPFYLYFNRGGKYASV